MDSENKFPPPESPPPINSGVLRSILNKDSVWNKIKKYVFFIIYSLILLLILLLSILILNVFIFIKLINNQKILQIN